MHRNHLGSLLNCRLLILHFFLFSFFLFFSFFFLSFCLFRSPPVANVGSRLGVQSELRLPAYATAMTDPSCVCYLHHSSGQHRTLNTLSEAGDWTWVLMDTSQICSCWATTGMPVKWISLGGLVSMNWTNECKGKLLPSQLSEVSTEESRMAAAASSSTLPASLKYNL